MPRSDLRPFRLRAAIDGGSGEGERRGPAGFRSSRSANVTIIFALSLLPLIGLVGLGVDYGMALSTKAKLDNAADAAAIAAVATAKTYIAANAASQTDPTLTNNAIAAGLDRATRAFAVNAGSLPFAAVPTPTLTLTRSLQTFSSISSDQTASVNDFGKIFGNTTTLIPDSTAAAADVPSYLDVHLLIDVSALDVERPERPGGQHHRELPVRVPLPGSGPELQLRPRQQHPAPLRRRQYGRLRPRWRPSPPCRTGTGWACTRSSPRRRRWGR